MDPISVDIQDAETNKIYSILVTAEEAKRLQTDYAFARQKLSEAINKNDIDLCDSNKCGQSNECVENENELLQGVQDEEVEGMFKWPHEAILLLIDEYTIRQNDFTTGKMSHKKLWSLIAAEIVKHGHNVSGPQFLSKFSGLKRTYKAIKDNNKKSGSGTNTWPYFCHMDNLLHSKPYISLLTTVSSTGKKTEAQSECSTSSAENLENEKLIMHKKPRQMSSVEKLMDDLRTDRKMAEEAMEKRHKENVELRQQFLCSFEKMLEILSKK